MSNRPAKRLRSFHSLPSNRFQPLRYSPGGIGNWSGHLPFAADLIDALKPSLLVELGTHFGESYFGFCQAIQAQGLDCRAFAVDTWMGDSQTGSYGPEVFEEVSAYNAAHYQSFSTLLRKTFDEASPLFGDETIDLLHLDGCHTYAAIQHDFTTWFPRVKPGGVVLFHDIAVRTGDFGAWKLWEEVSSGFPSFAFQHDCGLGVLFKGDSSAIRNRFLAELLTGAADAEGIRDYYVLCAERLQYAHRAAGEFTSFCQMFSPDSAGYSKDRSSTYPVSAGAATVVEFSLPPPKGRLRLDPSDCPGVIEISDVAVEMDGSVVWRLDPARVQQIDIAGTGIRIPEAGKLILFSYGDDPQLYLPLLESLPPEAPLRVRCTLRIDRDWQAIGSVWREMEAGLARANAQVEAHRQRADELDARSEHYKNLLDEAGRKIADAETRLAQAESEAAHHKNLLNELEQKHTEAGARLLESSTQSAHYKNLVEELQKKHADTETRLLESSSQIAHHKNLLKELEHKRADAENRLAESSSQAAHYKNLLEELEHKRADAENRSAQFSSEAAHYKNLLGEQLQKQAAAETRLEQAASDAAGYRELLENLRQKHIAAEMHLAEAAKQAERHNDLVAEFARQRREIDSLRSAAADVQQSLSWRLTAPLRFLGSLLRIRGG
jgi:predicted  nucleic acid-binding Zn-ribbon protein